ncbi:MAG TPA: hypothetical protein VFG53_20890 [Anaeromyxobacter sp.]|nr:hypothetical protein [Anaeromyxobacter sp.]
MNRTTIARAAFHLLLGLAAFGPVPPVAAGFAEQGTVIDQAELATIAGGKAALLSTSAKANVLVFFRSDQDHSTDALRELAACEKELGPAVHWAALVSGASEPSQAKAAAAGAGIKMPVLLDAGDKLYDKLKVRLHPAVLIADGKGILQVSEPYRQVDFADAVKAQVRFVLGEIDRATRDRALDPQASRMPGEDPMNKALRDVNMAKKMVELGQYDLAVAQAQKALERAPIPAAYPVLATAYAKLGRCADSRKMLEQAQKLPTDANEVAAARALCAGK